MGVFPKRTLSAVAILCSLHQLQAQDLAPRAYIIAPVHSNALTLTYSFNSGNLTFDGQLPISNATAKVSVSVLNYAHSVSLFGRTANFLASVPYGVGNFHGTVMAAETNVYRSGLLASAFRFSVNLKGGPAMDVQDFIKWQQKTLIGASLRVVTPTGQYDGTKLINFGANRWAFKPEVGVSQRWRHWLLDAYGAVWFFTVNDDFFSRNQYNPGVTSQSEAPVGAFEGHLSYDVKPRFWASLDGNFWFGGRTSLNGQENIKTLQRNSRVGSTVSVPVSKHQSLKFSYSNGAYIRYGGDYQAISLGWQYSWVGRPK
ncbi:MAG TPA: transporter [Terriglobales bacterium]|nr:transporter [Terriglobales bacterium]